MLKDELERYLIKWALIFFVLLSIIDLVFFRNRWFILLGLAVGGGFSILRFRSMSAWISTLISQNDIKHSPALTAIKHIINQLAVVAIMVAALLFNKWFFAGAVAGLLLVPSVVFVFCILQAAGITKKFWD